MVEARKDAAAGNRGDASGKWPVWIASIITVLWGGLFSFLLANASGCAQTGTFLADHITCLSANELGDTLAGAFAPLAFLWLIAAVLLQKGELSAQRQELREGHEVARQQVEEARRNVEFIAQQTRLLERQTDKAEISDAESDIDELLDVFCAVCDQLEGRFAVWDANVQLDGLGHTTSYNATVTKAPGNNRNERAKYYIDRFDMLDFELDIMAGGYVHKGMDLMKDSQGILNQIVGLTPRISEPKKALLAYVGVTKGAAACEAIASILASSGRPFDPTKDRPIRK